MHSKLLVLQKLEVLYSEMMPTLRNFPKAERFTLAQVIQNTSLSCIDKVLTANLDKPNRVKNILHAQVTIQRLQVLVRIAKTHKFMDEKRYEIFSEKITEVSKMLNGWRESAKKQAAP